MSLGSVLIVDDEELIRMSLKDALEKAGFEILQAESGEEALRLLKINQIDLIILDLVLPGMGGFKLLKQLRGKLSDIQIIVITAFSSIETAVESIRLGAIDYLPKPFNLDEVVIKARKAMETKRLVNELDRFRTIQEINLKSDKIIYKSKEMEEVIERVKKVAHSTIETILVTGETGTGKELVAKAIHLLSDRANKPFVALNCIAVPQNLLESELFGYEKGAFTDAFQSRKGLIEEAEGGALLLDEIGDMDVGLQGKLLRFIDERTVRRIAGRKEIQIDIKLIIATNKDMMKALAEGTFRPDLLHRINLVNIHVPPLRERKEDIPVLARYFLDKYKRKHGKKAKGFTKDAMGVLVNHHWMGNVRELKNLIEQTLIFEGDVEVITMGILMKSMRKGFNSHSTETIDRGSFLMDHLLLQKDFTFKNAVEEFSKSLIRGALKLSNNNKVKAARLLKMDRSTLNYQIKTFDI